MFQYSYLRQLQRYLPRSEIFGVDIPEFVPRSDNYVGRGNSITIKGGHLYPFEVLSKMVVQNGIRILRFGGYAQRMEYLAELNEMRQLFSLPKAVHDERFSLLTSDKYITCIVRANEILTAVHPDYPPTPISFYRAAVEDSGRIPVLMGQTSSNFYSDSLRKLFPDCVVYEHVSPLEDFRFIINSTNVAIAVSTFAWMASYLSSTAKRSYFPVFGLFNPNQREDVDLLPKGDDRYRFAEFETMRWAAEARQIAYVLDPTLPVSFVSK
jgi:hypothetical protein